MKEIRTFEEAIEQNARSLKELGINGTLFWAYRTSKETGNELIDFNDARWEDWNHVERATAEWVYWFNTDRLNSGCGHTPPIEYEIRYHQTHPDTTPVAA